MKSKVTELDWAAGVLVVTGAINWGLVGAFKFDLVMAVFGTSPVLAQVVYGIIGMSGLYWLYRMITMKN